jgi:hypothetical protein
MVPSRPSSGAAVTMVSRAQSQRPSACSIRVASSAARDSTHHVGRALVQDHAEESPEVVARVHLTDALLELLPGEGVGLEDLEDRSGQASAGREDEGLLEDHHHRDDREQQERVDHGAAHPQGGDEAREIH